MTMTCNVNEFFTPLDGFKNDHLYMTTMSLQLGTLLQLGALFRDSGQAPHDIGRTESDVLIGWMQGRVDVYYQADKLLMDPVMKIIDAGRLFKVCHAVAPTEEGVFHPKIMLLRMKKDTKENMKDEYHYRLMVSSRNLTGGDAFEVGVVLESIPVENELGDSELNHNLHELFGKLQEDDLADDLAKELENVVFYHKGEMDFKNIEVRVTGYGECFKTDIADYIDDFVIVSPNYETGSNYQDKPIYEPEDWPGGSHAKMYLHKNDRYLWLGSANCSKRALEGKNVECMVKLPYPDETICWDKDHENPTIFGIPFVKINEFTTLTVEGANEIGAFLHAYNIEMKEYASTDGKYQATVTFSLKDGESAPSPFPDIECKPLSVNDVDGSGKSKWVKIDPDKITKGTKENKPDITFKGRKENKPSGFLLLRCKDCICPVFCNKDVSNDEREKAKFEALLEKVLYRTAWLDNLLLKKTNMRSIGGIFKGLIETDGVEPVKKEELRAALKLLEGYNIDGN